VFAVQALIPVNPAGATSDVKIQDILTIFVSDAKKKKGKQEKKHSNIPSPPTTQASVQNCSNPTRLGMTYIITQIG
jgi:hypothetical protein